jgi:hypothetical protein
MLRPIGERKNFKSLNEIHLLTLYPIVLCNS